MHCLYQQKEFLFFSSLKYLLLLLLIPLFYSCVNQQSQDKSQEFTFVDKWRTDKDATIAQMSDSKRRHYDSQPELVREVLKKTLDGRFYEFKADGTVVFSIARNGKTNSFVGIWKYDPASGTLITTSEKGIETKFTVLIKSPDKIVLRNEKADKRSVLDDWVLQRIKI